MLPHAARVHTCVYPATAERMGPAKDGASEQVTAVRAAASELQHAREYARWPQLYREELDQFWRAGPCREGLDGLQIQLDREIYSTAARTSDQAE